MRLIATSSLAAALSAVLKVWRKSNSALVPGLAFPEIACAHGLRMARHKATNQTLQLSPDSLFFSRSEAMMSRPETYLRC